MEMVFFDDICEEIYDAMEGHPHRCHFEGAEAVADENGRYCHCPVKHKATLGRIVELLHRFRDMPENCFIPAIPAGSFEKKLLSMYLSYLPRERSVYDLRMNCDARGSFTELVKTLDHGQVSVNISKPGVTKGQHWHLSKWELFIVVKGHGLIQMRNLLDDEIEEYEVDGSRIQAVYMKPGWTHNIINLSETEDLVTIMFANETLNQDRPDTYFEPVKR
jgi:UDP-2-acetamido-2,6-beta-L-arabino-hexul-4-ose reductase